MKTSKPKEIEQYMTVLDFLKKYFPDKLEKWDRHWYTVYAPLSLDDDLNIFVILKNADGTRQKLTIMEA